MKKYWIMTAVVVFVLSLLVHPSTTNAANTVVYVKSNAGGANNGSSWANAYTSLSAALTASNPANGNTVEIWVAAGTYKPTQDGNRDVAFTMKNNVSLYGGFNGTETTRDERNFVAHPTILSGDLNGNDTANVSFSEASRAENSKVVVEFQDINNSVTIDGFQVIGGHNVEPVNILGSGSGIVLESSQATVRNITLKGNVTGYGGGIYMHDSTSSIINVQFINNVGGFSGGGVYAELGHPYLSNAVFTANRSNFGSGGGALAVKGATLTASNITSSGNIANKGGFISTSNNATVDLANSIIWNDTASNGGAVFIDSSTVSIKYSLIQGGYTGTGNISGDPRFIDAAQGDLKLDDASPAIDAGNNTLVALDVTDVDHDGNTSEVLPLDVANAPRFVDHPQPDSGVGSPPIVDMGAYETPAPVYITVSGKVTDSNGNPVSGATVSPFTVQGVEVTQVIQNMANSIPLVADKPTVTRVYVKSYSSNRLPVTVQLSGKQNNAPLANSPLSTQVVAPINPLRANYSDSANFMLPASWLNGQVNFTTSFAPDIHAVAVTDANGNYTLTVKPGTYTLFAQKDATTYGSKTVVLTEQPQTVNFGFAVAYRVYIPLVNSANATTVLVGSNNVTVTFTAVPAMNIKILPINYTYQGTTYPAPATSEFDKLATYIKYRYPVSTVNITFANPVSMNAMSNEPPTADMLKQVLALKQSDGAPSSQFYYGVSKIPNGIDNAAGRGYVGIRAAASVSAGEFLAAHEMGHNVGLSHPCEDPSSPYKLNGLIGEYGINLSTNPPQVYAPNETSSIMNPGCSFPFYQNSWFSDYEYLKMFNDQVTNGLLNNKKLDSLIMIQ